MLQRAEAKLASGLILRQKGCRAQNEAEKCHDAVDISDARGGPVESRFESDRWHRDGPDGLGTMAV